MSSGVIARRCFEDPFLAEDLRVELLQRAARFDPELVDEHAPALVVGLERVGLPAGAVQREHQLAAEPLTQRVGTHERLDIADDLAVPFELELRLEPLLGRNEPELLEPLRLAERERLELRVRERRAAPECKRLSQQARPLGAVRGTSFAQELLEAPEVELVGLDREHVARGLGQEDVRPEELPEL